MNDSQMTLGRDFDHRWQDVRGWLASEKFDGCRAFWDGDKLWTRGGNVIQAPDWFTQQFPAGQHLDGEIWAGRGQFYAARNAVNHGKFNREIRFMCFDVPKAAGTWAERITHCVANDIIQLVTWNPVASLSEMEGLLQLVKSCGGEGLVLRNPAITTYEKTRTWNFLKVKKVTWR